jgi:hypothetical protein
MTLAIYYGYFSPELLLDRMIAPPPAHTILRVYTDRFPVYRLFDERPNYTHFTVVHNNNFGEGIRHTNSIEGFWNQLKALGNFGKDFNATTVEQVLLLKIIFATPINVYNIGIMLC